MTIGPLEKKLEGGGGKSPPPALIPLGKQPARRMVKGFERGADPSPIQEGLIILNVLLFVCNFKDWRLQQFSTG